MVTFSTFFATKILSKSGTGPLFFWLPSDKIPPQKKEGDGQPTFA
jgi:hypothetical protein